jgi:hypothetical protein
MTSKLHVYYNVNYNVTTELRKIKTNDKNITSNQRQYDNKKYNTIIVITTTMSISYTYLFLIYYIYIYIDIT